MSLPIHASSLRKMHSADSAVFTGCRADADVDANAADCDEGFTEEEVKLIEQYMSNGYKITRKDERQNLLTLERPDEIKCRGRRP